MQMIARSTLIDGPGTRAGRVVLYRRDHDFHPYVVHNMIEADGSMFQGSYCANIGDAGREFVRRCRLHGVKDEVLVSEGEEAVA